MAFRWILGGRAWDVCWLREKVRVTVQSPVRKGLLPVAQCPSAGRRLVGPQFCSSCGQSLNDVRSLVVEYWRAEETLFACWCNHCDATYEVWSPRAIVSATRVEQTAANLESL